MDVTLYGIPNCDQVKKARNWLNEQGIGVHFHDFKKDGVTPELLGTWLLHLDRNSLINRKGTTWRKLSVQEQSQVIDNASAISCMVQSPSIIKRPVLVLQNRGQTEIIAGFSEENYRRLLVTDN